MTRNGPYRFVRHPMYAGTMLMLAGWHAHSLPRLGGRLLAWACPLRTPRTCPRNGARACHLPRGDLPPYLAVLAPGAGRMHLTRRPLGL